MTTPPLKRMLEYLNLHQSRNERHVYAQTGTFVRYGSMKVEQAAIALKLLSVRRQQSVVDVAADRGEAFGLPESDPLGQSQYGWYVSVCRTFSSVACPRLPPKETMASLADVDCRRWTGPRRMSLGWTKPFLPFPFHDPPYDYPHSQ